MYNYEYTDGSYMKYGGFSDAEDINRASALMPLLHRTLRDDKILKDNLYRHLYGLTESMNEPTRIPDEMGVPEVHVGVKIGDILEVCPNGNFGFEVSVELRVEAATEYTQPHTLADLCLNIAGNLLFSINASSALSAPDDSQSVKKSGKSKYVPLELEKALDELDDYTRDSRIDLQVPEITLIKPISKISKPTPRTKRK